MDASSVLRQQSQNTILRTINEPNKMTAEPKSSKTLSLHSLKQNPQYHDPGRIRPPHLHSAVSRLPVLAKSLHLQTPNDFTQSHCVWEDKPLAGKTKTKKPCTRPVPFNLSQPKASRAASENQPLNRNNSTRNPVLDKRICNSQCKTTNRTLKHSNTLKENVKSTKLTENASLGKSRHFHSHKTSASASKPAPAALITKKNSTVSSEQPASAAEACSENMNLLSLKDTTSDTVGDNVDNFQHDHAALLSILHNEGVSSAMTQLSKPYNFLPQRVSIMKSCQKAEPNPGTSMKMVQFSPDAGALQSILQNEGVKAVGHVGTTPRISVRPGRNTSIYMAQRVPVRKNLLESTAGLMALKQTPVQKWTPQRVTRHQPMSTKKWHTSAEQSRYATPSGFTGFKASLCTEKEEVVQKLFVEDEPTTDDVSVPPTELPQDQTTCKEVMKNLVVNEEKENGLDEPFLQAPERESVIFFSAGKKLFRDPRFKNPERSGDKQHSSESLPVLQHGCQSSATVTKDLLTQKTGVMNPAVAILRKRLPPLEELRLDEEVATYTSVSIPMVSGFHTPRPRCGNPLATLLHFEDSSRFVPICVDVFPDSLHER